LLREISSRSVRPSGGAVVICLPQWGYATCAMTVGVTLASEAGLRPDALRMR
jgi:hypothetical protein